MVYTCKIFKWYNELGVQNHFDGALTSKQEAKFKAQITVWWEPSLQSVPSL